MRTQQILSQTQSFSGATEDISNGQSELITPLGHGRKYYKSLSWLGD